MFGSRSASKRSARNVREAGSMGSAPMCEQLEDRLLLSLLGVGDELGLPEVYYDAYGKLDYSAATQSLDVDAAPTDMVLVDGGPIYQIYNLRNFRLNIKVDNNGQVIGGVAGDDLYIEGELRLRNDPQTEALYSGVLLTGEIVAFGYLDAGTYTDIYDYRFTPTGGSLMPFFEGKDIGVDMTSLKDPNSTAPTFDGSFAHDFHGLAQGVVGAIPYFVPPPPPPSSIAGRVFNDANNNGVDDAEAGIAGVSIALSGTDVDLNAVNLSTTTGADGSYLFADLVAGTYTVTETQDINYLDGIDSATDLNAVVGDDVISAITIAAGEDATGYNFGEIVPGSLSGLVFEDFNNDGEINFGEAAIEGATITLTGTDDRGAAVNVTEQTDVDGVYFFVDLRPGTYTITETQPAGYADGQDTLGTAGGIVGDDVFSAIELAVGIDGMNYNFSERAAAGAEVTQGQTATIGFWQNKNGQKLIKALNGGPDATQLGNWLAVTFPNIYSATAGANNLAGMTNAKIALHYRSVFKAKKNAGPKKVDSQVMATVLAVYVTNSTLAGTTAAQYGFLVTEGGLGTATFSIGDAGAAFGVENNTLMTILDMLLATNEQAVNGDLYGLDAILRQLANDVYSSINEAGDI